MGVPIDSRCPSNLNRVYADNVELKKHCIKNQHPAFAMLMFTVSVQIDTTAVRRTRVKEVPAAYLAPNA